jgi:excisionase family DNA binding protein
MESKNLNGSTYLKSTEISKLLRVSPEKVLGWIRRGELTAIDVGDGKRSEYRVHQEDLSAFLARREVKPPPPYQRRKPRRPAPPEGGPIDPELGEKLLKKGQAVKVGKKYYRIWNGIIQFI